MDDIFDLLLRYWWLVGIIILRVVVSNVGKKKKQSESSSSGRTERKSQLQEYLEKMRAELDAPAENPSQSLPAEVPFYNDADDAAYLGHASDQQERQAKLMQKLREKQKAKALADSRSSLIPETYQPTDAAEALLPAAGTRVEKKSFPENLAYLPPLQQAFIFSEIFGSPKGLD